MTLFLKQLFHFQARGTPDIDRRYALRKRQAAPDRTTFVCYVCALDCPSSQLRLVYCCANAEREPYYPFIKTKSAPTNASPISPQGMVQICVSCNQQNMHLAEGGTPATNPAAADDRLSQSSNSVASSQQQQREQVPIHVPSSVASLPHPLAPQYAAMVAAGTAGNPAAHASSKASGHDPGTVAVRYKVSFLHVHFCQLADLSPSLSLPALRFNKFFQRSVCAPASCRTAEGLLET